MKISEIKLNKKNPRLIKDYKFEKLKKSITEFPKMLELRPIIIDNDNIILGGNMRYQALKDLGYKELPDNWVKKSSELSEEEKQRFIMVDNISYGDFDWDIIANEWDTEILADWGLDVPSFELEAEQLEAVEDDFDTTPPEIPITVLGDLYEIGEHRLLCGDSTDSDQVAKLMNNQKADMVFTDPPYNVGFNGRSGKFEVIKNDNLSINDFENLINGFISILQILNPQNYYIWCNWKFYGILQNKLDYKACIVWAKNVFGLGRGYRHQHEFCLFNGNLDEGINNESDLWEIAKDVKYEHPTQKPIALALRALNNHKTNKYIVDLFLGSGSTMVASHQLKRKCYGMELDPKYCDVIVKRMIKLDNTLIIKRNGIDVTKEFKE